MIDSAPNPNIAVADGHFISLYCCPTLLAYPEHAVRYSGLLPPSLFYSLQSRVVYVLSVHLPSQTRRLAAAIDEALREAYARVLGTDILDPEGDFPEQPDPTSTLDRFWLKHSLGGGFRLRRPAAPSSSTWGPMEATPPSPRSATAGLADLYWCPGYSANEHDR